MRNSKKIPLWLGLSLAVLACGRDAAPARAQAPAAGRANEDLPAVLATIGNEKITLADVLARRRDDLDQLDFQYRKTRYKLLASALDDILRERVLGAEAEKQGKTIDQLIETEAGSALNPTDVEISAWYSENQARLGGRTLEQVKPQIAEFLRQQRREAATARLEARLNAERNVVIHLPPFRVQLDNAGAPSKGAPNAPVTLVEFADFQCPFCGRFYPTVDRVAKEFSGKVRVVYRQYPIAQLHPFAWKAAEASLCANEQGKFWELHDLMYQEQNKLSVTDLKEKARRLGFNSNQFDACLDASKYVERVQNDFKEGTKAGVTGTPALFVNGVAVEGGAVSFEALASAVRKELDRIGKR